MYGATLQGLALLVGVLIAQAPDEKASAPPRRGRAVGQLAPDIRGEDIDGKKFKLSDYRGKVVVLDFWGNW